MSLRSCSAFLNSLSWTLGASLDQLSMGLDDVTNPCSIEVAMVTYTMEGLRADSRYFLWSSMNGFREGARDFAVEGEFLPTRQIPSESGIDGPFYTRSQNGHWRLTPSSAGESSTVFLFRLRDGRSCVWGPAPNAPCRGGIRFLLDELEAQSHSCHWFVRTRSPPND